MVLGGVAPRAGLRPLPAVASRQIERAERVRRARATADPQALGADWFVGHGYSVDNGAIAGRGIELLRGAGPALRREVQALGQLRHLSPRAGIALSGKVLCDVQLLHTATDQIGRSISWTLGQMARQPGLAGRIGQSGQQVSGRLRQAIGPDNLQAFNRTILEAGAIGNLALVGAALPVMAKDAVAQAVTTTQLARDPHAGRAAKLEAWKKLAFTGSAVLGGAASVPASFELLATGGGLHLPLPSGSVTGSGSFGLISGAARAMMPVSDALLLAGDLIHLYQVANDPQATSRQRLRAGMNVGIVSARMVAYAAPKTRMAPILYTAAGLTQIGLAACDLVQGLRHG